MSARTNRDRVLDVLRRSARALDDDELSERAQVRPRQQMNQICRVLEGKGLIRRYEGPDLKIVNERGDVAVRIRDFCVRAIATHASEHQALAKPTLDL